LKQIAGEYEKKEADTQTENIYSHDQIMMKHSEAMSKLSAEEDRRSSIKSGRLGRSGLVDLSESKSTGHGAAIDANTQTELTFERLSGRLLVYQNTPNH